MKAKGKKAESLSRPLLGEVGKFFLDIAKLVFGGIILASIMKADIEQTVLFVVGTITVVLLASAGFLFIRHSNYKK